MAYVFSGSTPKDRAKWQALYSIVGSFKHACDIADDVILWPTTRPDTEYLKRWALQIDDGLEVPDPAHEKIIRKKLEVFKQAAHWDFIYANIKAGKTLTQQVLDGNGSGKEALALSYIGNVVNFGMDKGEHAQKQASAQTLNVGNVRIVSGRAEAQIPKSKLNKAKKLNAGATSRIVNAVAVKVLD